MWVLWQACGVVAAGFECGTQRGWGGGGGTRLLLSGCNAVVTFLTFDCDDAICIREVDRFMFDGMQVPTPVLGKMPHTVGWQRMCPGVPLRLPVDVLGLVVVIYRDLLHVSCRNGRSLV